MGQPYFLTLASWSCGDGGQHVKLNLIPGFPSLLSCIFIGAPGAYHFWKFTKRLTAEINNKKIKKGPLLKPLTLWNKPLCLSTPGILHTIKPLHCIKQIHRLHSAQANAIHFTMFFFLFFETVTLNLNNAFNVSLVRFTL